MTGKVEYRCSCCGDVHHSWPDWHFRMPDPVLSVPRDERDTRVELTEDTCVIDNREFYVKALLSLPIQDSEETLTWGVWISLSGPEFGRYRSLLRNDARAAGSEFVGWMSNQLPGFESPDPLAAALCTQKFPLRPIVELNETAHPLSVAQHRGVPAPAALAQIELLLHGTRSPGGDAAG